MEGFKNLFTESVRKGGRKLFPAKQKSINGGGGYSRFTDGFRKMVFETLPKWLNKGNWWWVIIDEVWVMCDWWRVMGDEWWVMIDERWVIDGNGWWSMSDWWRVK